MFCNVCKNNFFFLHFLFNKIFISSFCSFALILLATRSKCVSKDSRKTRKNILKKIFSKKKKKFLRFFFRIFWNSFWASWEQNQSKKRFCSNFVFFLGCFWIRSLYQLVVLYHWLAFLNQVHENLLSARNLKWKFC